jgi:hypothetical protein
VNAIMTEPPVEALGELLAGCIVEVSIGRYECRQCDADVTHAPFVHDPECEYPVVYEWLQQVVP